MHNLVIFASGRGSNARAIADYFASAAPGVGITGNGVRVALVVANKPGLGVLHWAEAAGIPTLVADGKTMSSPAFVETLHTYNPALIVLAGFIRMVPEPVLAAFPDRIVNIHPALLPKFGGKGMWGTHVHTAVLDAGEGESGMTIHRVTAQYDEGAVLLQARCPVLPADAPDDLAARVLQLEHWYYPRVIHFLLQENAAGNGDQLAF
jgi:phosphoribosylglycinamide formyltransferase-1